MKLGKDMKKALLHVLKCKVYRAINIRKYEPMFHNIYFV